MTGAGTTAGGGERPAETLQERLERLRREYASGGLAPSPPSDAPPPPPAWSDTDADRGEVP
jgi:hypothetical protein